MRDSSNCSGTATPKCASRLRGRWAISKTRGQRLASGAIGVLDDALASAASPSEAKAIARRIATSPLVKTAAFGYDGKGQVKLRDAAQLPSR